MADPSLLGILSGTNPLDPQILQGQVGAQQYDASLNPNVGHNEGPFGWLGKTLLGMGGMNAMRQAVQQTTNANTAASPDLAKLLANPDPYAALAQGGANPVAAARLLQGATPETVAAARNQAAQAALAQLNVKGYQRMLDAGAVPSASTISTPASSKIAPVQGTGTQSPFTGATSYPGEGGSAASYQQATGIDPVMMVMDPSTPAQLRGKTVAAMTPQQRAQLRAAILAKMNAGGANAARSQP